MHASPTQPHRHQYQTSPPKFHIGATYNLPRLRRRWLNPRPGSSKIPTSNIRQLPLCSQECCIWSNIANVTPEAPKPGIPPHVGKLIEVIHCGLEHILGWSNVLMGKCKLGNPEGHVGVHVSVVAKVRRKALEVSIPTRMVNILGVWLFIEGNSAYQWRGIKSIVQPVQAVKNLLENIAVSYYIPKTAAPCIILPIVLTGSSKSFLLQTLQEQGLRARYHLPSMAECPSSNALQHSEA